MSNHHHFDGRLAADPVRKESGKPCRFKLIRNEYAGRNEDESKRADRVVSIEYTAFGADADAIVKHARKGDQLIVVARVENNNYTDGAGVERYGFNWVVSSWEFGAPGEATRSYLANRDR
ncbi:single-stranded DNA-binding protein [Xanthomonas campestris pv. campestris]|uniref:single-stranded DNA-binding protein n=1 Tax=Xanthomonas campestris TaxID=339 RepID=UPI001E60C4EE|nr:single-stranded DNA-binding protein [Xanthomonas campestris]MCD0253121.1 single-stranded DNA-binding protein [Xanthomonas campestris pv. campestris]